MSIKPEASFQRTVIWYHLFASMTTSVSTFHFPWQTASIFPASLYATSYSPKKGSFSTAFFTNKGLYSLHRQGNIQKASVPAWACMGIVTSIQLLNQL